MLYFFFRLQLLLPRAPKILGCVWGALAHPQPGEGMLRTGPVGGRTCPAKDVGFIHQSEIGCTKPILAKIEEQKKMVKEMQDLLSLKPLPLSHPQAQLFTQPFQMGPLHLRVWGFVALLLQQLQLPLDPSSMGHLLWDPRCFMALCLQTSQCHSFPWECSTATCLDIRIWRVKSQGWKTLCAI